MRPIDSPVGRKTNPIIHAARREQIVDAAIETVAALGYSRTSLSRIAQQAQTSKSVVSYHFAGKDELLEQVVLQIYADTWAFIEPRVKAEHTATGKLRAYITAELDYMREQRARLLTVGRIVANHRTADGSPRFTPNADESTIGVLTEILRRGQRDDEFRDFDPHVVAVTISQAIDGALSQSADDPTVDLSSYAEELTSLFYLATRKMQETA